MAKFIRVRSYLNGPASPPSDLVLNVEHIVSFHAGLVKFDGTNDADCVYLDTIKTSGLIIEGTIDNLQVRLARLVGISNTSLGVRRAGRQ